MQLIDKLRFIVVNHTTFSQVSCVFSFKSQTISRLLRDYEFWCESKELRESSKEVLLMRDFLQQSFNALTYSSSMLAFQLRERMASCQLSTPLLKELIKDATRWIETTPKALMIPVLPIGFYSVDSPIRLNLLAGLLCTYFKDINPFSTSNTIVCG